MMTASRMAIVLRQHPYPDAVVTLDGLGCNIRVNGVHLLYDMTWQTADGQTVPVEWPTFDSPDDGDRIHAEIRRVLAIVNAPSDDPLYDRATAEQALAKISAERDEATARADKVEDRLHRDDELREQIAVAVGVDGSASLALILDTVNRDRPGREFSRLSGLLDVLAAPVAFGERRLSTAERAEWALRRWLAEGKASDARIAQLIEAEVFLDCVGVPAYAAVPGDDPGDATEALTLPERLRLHFAAR